MKKHFFFSFFCLLLLSQNSWASHFVSGNIQYKSLGAGNYLITYTEFADCSGILPVASLPVQLSPIGACGGAAISVTLYQTSVQDITPICPGLTTSCSGGAVYGVRETVYQDTVNAASFACSTYRISYQNCCRAYNMANGGAGTNYYVFADTLDFGVVNSSPEFMNNPVVAVCAGQITSFSQAAFDADGDSLVYSLGPSLQGYGNSIAYNIGYSPTTPLGPGWNVYIDASTGQMHFNSTGAAAIGTFCVAVYIDEYRNGQHLGTSMRDMQVIVENCAAGQAYNCCYVDYNFTISGNTASFTALTASNNTVLSYDWDFGDGSTSTLANPTHAYANINYYYAKLVVNYVSGCSDSASYLISINSVVNANYTYLQTGAMSFDFTDISTSLNPIVSWTWDFGDGNTSSLQNPSHTYSAPGAYIVCLTVIDNIGFSGSVCQSIVANTTPIAAYNYSYISPDSVQLIGMPFNGTPPYSYTWTSTIGTILGSPYIANPVIVYTNSGTDIVCLYITDANGFTDSACQSIIVNIPLSCDPLFSFTTNNMSADFTPSNFNANTIYTINYGDGSPTASIGPVASPPTFSHTYANNGIYTVCMNATNGACSQDTCFNVAINIGVDIDGYIYSAPAGGTPDSFIVYLIEYTNTGGGTLTLIDSQYVAGNPAYYNFTNVNSATLIFHTKAAMTLNSPNYATYIPTYYDSALVWAASTPICIPCMPPLPATFDIYMQAGNNPGGPGFIGGLISQGANKTGSPAQHIEVMLWDMNDNPVTYTYTDMNGNFGIPNLDYGTYKVYPEVVGLVTEPYLVTITGMNPSFTGVDMTMGDSLIAPTVVGLPSPTLLSAIAYPNPANELLIFQAELAYAGKIQIEMYNTLGQKSYYFEEKANSGKYIHQIPIKEISEGVYTLKIATENNGTQTIKVIVIH